jgi:cysteine desulfurase NifS
MVELANRLGYGKLYPQTEKKMIQFALKGSGYTLEDVKKAGGWIKNQSPMMAYKKWEKGGLRSDANPGFDTPSGKFEIWSTVLEDYGYEPLPKYIEPAEGPLSRPDLKKEYPLVFNSGARPQTDFRSQHHGIPGLVKENPEPLVEINTLDAKARTITSGDLVEVYTARGKVLFRAKVTADIVQGAVECNMGGGTAVGPKAWQEWNVNELADLQNYDEISGFPVYKSLLCEVSKVKAGTAKSKKRVESQKDTMDAHLFHIALKPSRSQKLIYLDNNATTQVADQVREAMIPYLKESFGNPSAIHRSGHDAQEGVENARRWLAKLINAKPKRIIFTGGGSESDNLALKGVAFAHRAKGNHIITSSIEHPAILKTCKFLEGIGYRITYLPVDAYGLINVNELERFLTKQTILVSVMLANNEVGTIQPIKALCQLAHQHNILFHSDAVQAAGKIKIDVEDLGVDLLTLSGHKFHGPKGIGVLYVKRGIELEPLVHGGKQEKGLRAGTENVPAMVGMGKAAELAIQSLPRNRKIKRLRDKLEKSITELIPDAQVNGHPKKRLPNTLNLTLPDLRGESLVIALDQHGIALSSGSACKSGSPDPTHVLIAMGKSEAEAHCSVRFSLSQNTNTKDIEKTVNTLSQVLEEMENTVRFLPCK